MGRLGRCQAILVLALVICLIKETKTQETTVEVSTHAIRMSPTENTTEGRNLTSTQVWNMTSNEAVTQASNMTVCLSACLAAANAMTTQAMMYTATDGTTTRASSNMTTYETETQASNVTTYETVTRAVNMTANETATPPSNMTTNEMMIHESSVSACMSACLMSTYEITTHETTTQLSNNGGNRGGSANEGKAGGSNQETPTEATSNPTNEATTETSNMATNEVATETNNIATSEAKTAATDSMIEQMTTISSGQATAPTSDTEGATSQATGETGTQTRETKTLGIHGNVTASEVPQFTTATSVPQASKFTQTDQTTSATDGLSRTPVVTQTSKTTTLGILGSVTATEVPQMTQAHEVAIKTTQFTSATDGVSQIFKFSTAAVEFTTRVMPQVTAWSEWGLCSASCGPGVQIRTRNCTDLNNSSRHDCTERLFDTQYCDEGLCACSVDSVCSEQSCGNSKSSQIHQCKEATCGQFTCSCASGYEVFDISSDGQNSVQSCRDKNECLDASNVCNGSGKYAPGVIGCQNTIGSYECLCGNGYSYVSSTKTCADVNECEGKNDCDPGRSSCKNTQGSYMCSCSDPYQGDGKAGTCRDGRLLKFSAHKKVKLGEDFTPYLESPLSLPYDTRSFSRVVYATKSGVVLMVDLPGSSTTEQRKEFSSPSEKNLNDFTFHESWKERVLISPYWSTSELSSDADSGLFYNTFEITNASSGETTTALQFASAVVNAYDSSLQFKAQYAAVFTWNKMKDPENQNSVTFQCILTSDYNNTYAAFIYEDRAMNWKKTLSPGQNFRARVGIKTPRTSKEYENSYLQHGKDQTLISRMDQQTQHKNGQQGRFVYSLTTGHDASFVHAGLACRTWITDDKNSTFSTEKANLAPSGREMVDESFWVDITKTGSPVDGVRCFESMDSFFIDGEEQPKLRACYRDGALLTEGEPADFLNTLKRYSGDKNNLDHEAARHCCLQANIDSFASSYDLCEDYLTRRPIVTSAKFINRKPASGIGDPHFLTFDGKMFTFNGRGEYILAKVDGEFEVQARATPVMKNGKAQDATILTSVAAKQMSPLSDVVEFRLNSSGSGIDVYINKTIQDGGGDKILSQHQSHNGVRLMTVTRDSETFYTMAFLTGVSVQVKVEFNLLRVVVIAPGEWKGKPVGLMGNSDDNLDNDFAYPNGTQLETGIDSTEEEIFFWGQEWRINNDTSLFYYDRANNESWAFFDEPNNIPVFFNSDLTIMFPDSVERAAAEEACYGQSSDPNPAARRQCYFDFKVTGSAEIAKGTQAAKIDVEAKRKALTNYPPIVKGNATLQVIVGHSYSDLHTLDATDQNGDAIYFLLNENAPSGLSVANDTKKLSWTSVKYVANATVQITATDLSASSLWVPKVELCNCQNSGVCQFGTNSLANFIIVPCQCPPGYAGDLCDTDIDGCADNPCHTTCTDVPAKTFAVSNVTFQCDPCPVGLVGNGQVCYDYDECLKDFPCEQKCENLPGSYVCSCSAGYNMAANLKNCTDEDECARGTDNCDAKATCRNTVGSFTCSCISGYSGSGYEGTCQDVDECSANTALCPNNSFCQNNEGSYDCVCIPGFKWNAQTSMCDAIDECLLGNNCAQECNDEVGKYSCSCKTGFKLAADLRNCEPASQCSAEQRAACDGGNNRSVCANDETNQGFLCQCPKGYALNSEKQCIDIDECSAGTALCRASSSECKNNEGSYTCECRAGYNQSSDGKTCEDVDECAKAGGTKCEQTCSNTVGSYICSCQKGYSLNSDGKTCNNINECAKSVLNNCDKTNGVCTDTAGGYTCSCKTGYALSGDLCIDLNECAQPDRGNCSQGCRNQIGTYMCYCGNGYTLNSDGRTCDDVNECVSDVSNDCYSKLYCSNTVGSYVCSCPSGFVLKSDGKTCESIEKCAADNTCSYTCARVNGTDICQCPSGQQLDGSGINCTDINECARSDTHLCDSTYNVVCENLSPGYKCVCSDSLYYTQVEGRKCVDKDECALGTYTCPSNSRCQNKSPGYSCECDPGYVDDGSGQCVDVDECSLGKDSCDDILGVCTNTNGSFTCACKAGYKGNGITCEDVDECVAGLHECDKEAGVCINNAGGYSCNCTKGYTMAANKRICNDIDECSGNHGCSHLCNNMPGTYRCSCLPHYRLDSDQKSCVVEFECNPQFASQCEFSCAKINGVDRCVCPNGKTLNTDNKTCDDVNECVVNKPCDATRGVCNNTDGSYKCACSDSFILGPGNTCTDRNGVWGVWGNWSTCTKTCDSGERYRMRQCMDKEGNGADCPGSGTERETCNAIYCPLDPLMKSNGVKIILSGPSLTIEKTKAAMPKLKAAVKKVVNEYCNSEPKDCCQEVFPSYTYTPDPNGTLVFIDTANVQTEDSSIIRNLATNNIEVMVVIIAEQDNALCASGKTQSSRLRRAITYNSSTEMILPQTSLLITLSDSAALADLTNVVSEATGVNVSVEGVSKAELPTLPTTTVAPPASTAAIMVNATAPAKVTTTLKSFAPTGLEPWVIPVAVVGGLVGLTIIVAIIIFIVKRPSKVGSASITQEDQLQATA